MSEGQFDDRGSENLAELESALRSNQSNALNARTENYRIRGVPRENTAFLNPPKGYLQGALVLRGKTSPGTGDPEEATTT